MKRAALAIAALLASAARADVRTYVVAIGNNSPGPGGSGPERETLHYADDDAAAFYGFTRDLSQGGALLTVLDADSQRRFPELVDEARAPTLAELRTVTARLRAQFEADREAGHDPILLFFYSGHGTRGDERRPASLALLDGPLTREVLHDEILAALPARYVHLLVDACHAEAIVRPRDVEAESVPLADEDATSYAARSTLARFPHVGAVIATSAAAQAHEWDVYQRGVFSHEVISALRGAADVNGDGRVEYSELVAFLGAANREVADPRARLRVVARPPALNQRAPLVDLGRLRGAARLVGPAAELGEIYVTDERGNRLLDVHAEPGYRVTLALPSGRRLFVHRQHFEAVLEAASGVTIQLAALAFVPSPPVRGSVALSLHRGLFAIAYGPRYYRGFIDRDELPPVPLVLEPPRSDTPPASPPPRGPRVGYAALGVGAGLSLAASLLGAVALDAALAANRSDVYQTQQAGAIDRFYGCGAASLVMLGAALTVGTVGALIVARARRHEAPRLALGR